MIKENKVSKYLLYAIGEIILVVIGILFALQINNANEYRKERLKAKVYIEKIIRDLEADKINLNELIQSAETVKNEIELYFDYFEKSNSTLDNLIDSAKHVRSALNRYLPINHTFKEMQSSGNMTLLSDNQKFDLINLTNQQEFFQIIIEKTISDIFVEHQNVRNYIDNGWANSDFFEKLGSSQDNQAKIQGLFHLHNYLQLNISLANLFITRGSNIKLLTIEVLEKLNINEN
jgi:hypothetical protein